MFPALKNARLFKGGLALAFSAAVLASPNLTLAAAGAPQICAPSSSCEVGEFLFDDDYNPLTGATCTITSKYPDDSAHLTSQALIGQSDGWYSHSFTAPSTTGYYRATICCTSGSDYLCIDKGFEVKASASSAPSADDVASAVWGYSDRTLSSFGTLVRDVWLNSTRSLTTLTVDNSSSTTTTNSEEVDLSDLEKTVNENRLLLEELVNEPIIETFISEDEQDLSTKLDETRTLANSLYANTEYVRSKSGSIVSKWNSLTDKELLSSINDIYKVIGGLQDSKNNTTITGGVNWLGKAWGWDVAQDLSLEVEKISKTVDGVQIDISTRGRSVSAYSSLKNLSENLDNIQSLIGDSTEREPNETLFGKLREVTLIAASLDSDNEKLLQVLGAWDETQESEIRGELNSISQSVSLLNRITQLNGYLAPSISTTTGKDLKNKAFAIGGVIEANRKVLARSSDSAIAATWLELGSIVFKSVIINPSSLISQTADLKYYLPPEVKEEHVLKIDDGLSVTYDIERDQYFVEGKFDLDPNETITVSLSIDDIWLISDSDLEAIRKQLDDLVAPLEGTAFFAQGVTLKSDIEVALDRISMLQSQAVTPEQKIRAYREASIELVGVYEKLESLKDLLTDVSSTGSMQAFVGGAQVFGVWGIVIVVIAAVTFLALYMRYLHDNTGKKKTKKSSPSKSEPKNITPPFVFGEFNWRSLAGSALGLLIFGGLVSATTAFAVIKMTSNQETSTPSVLSETTEVAVPAVGGEDIIKLVLDGVPEINIYTEANSSSDIITGLKFTTEATRLSSKNGFFKVVVRMGERGEDKVEGWVDERLVISHN